MVVDTFFDKTVKRYLALTYGFDLSTSQLRQHKYVRHIDTKLITASPAAGMSGQAIKQSECFPNLATPFQLFGGCASTTHPDVNKLVTFPNGIKPGRNFRDRRNRPARKKVSRPRCEVINVVIHTYFQVFCKVFEGGHLQHCIPEFRHLTSLINPTSFSPPAKIPSLNSPSVR